MNGSQTLSSLGSPTRAGSKVVSARHTLKAASVPRAGLTLSSMHAPLAPLLLMVFTIGLGSTALQADGWVTEERYQRLAPLLSSSTVCLALLASWIAFLRWRNAPDILAGRLALAVPSVVWASQAIVGTHVLTHQSPVSHANLPSLLTLLVGVVGTGLIGADVVSGNRTVTDSLVVRTLLCASGIGLASLLIAVSLRNHPALQFQIRDRVSSSVLPVAWICIAVALAVQRRSTRRLLRGCLSVFLLLLAAGQFLHRPGHLGVHGLRASLSAAAGVIAMVVVLIGLGCELRAAYETQQRRVMALEFDRALATAQLEADRLVSSRRSHDQRATLLSVEAVIRLLESNSATVDPAARQRLCIAATEELRRLRRNDDDNGAAPEGVDADLRALVEPIIAVARADGANVTMQIRQGLRVHVTHQAIVDIIRNLISNAVHHGNNRNTVVAARRVDYEFVELSVSDAGPGIASARRFDLFEPGRSSGGPGRSGLGLHSARSLLREIGGDLSLDRSYASGTRFVARIPVGTGMAQPVPVG